MHPLWKWGKKGYIFEDEKHGENWKHIICKTMESNKRKLSWSWNSDHQLHTKLPCVGLSGWETNGCLMKMTLTWNLYTWKNLVSHTLIKFNILLQKVQIAKIQNTPLQNWKSKALYWGLIWLKVHFYGNLNNLDLVSLLNYLSNPFDRQAGNTLTASFEILFLHLMVHMYQLKVAPVPF